MVFENAITIIVINNLVVVIAFCVFDIVLVFNDRFVILTFFYLVWNLNKVYVVYFFRRRKVFTTETGMDELFITDCHVMNSKQRKVSVTVLLSPE